MNGSEFERENIATDVLSAASASKPAEQEHEHDGRPPAEGLYDPSLEKDSCGVGFIANIKAKKSHQIVSDALDILCNLEHRGAVGADPRAGDGAGILVQIPHAFFARKAAEIGFKLPQPGDYAVGALFMPRETAWRKVIKSIIADQIKAEGLVLLGNVNWMAARQASVHSELYGKDISRLWPISYEGQSDTACFDNALEFLVQGGYSLPHAVMMMIPEAWAGNALMGEERRSFYEYHAAMMEPWDGPAAIAFTDGRQIGATLDRNGLRPARYLVTKDDRIVMASEMGVLPIAEKDIVTKWRLQPGKMLLVDLEQGRLIPDDEIKAQLANSHPYSEWLDRTQLVLEELPDAPAKAIRSNLPLLDRQQAFGYSQEDINI